MLGLILFAAAQGAAVFATAWLALRMLRRSSRIAKTIAMAASYAIWIAATLAGYIMLGGEGGFMDGFGMILFLCLTAIMSSLVYLLAWSIRART